MSYVFPAHRPSHGYILFPNKLIWEGKGTKCNSYGQSFVVVDRGCEQRESVCPGV